MKKLLFGTILMSVYLTSGLQALSFQSKCILKTTIGNDVFYINLKQVVSISHTTNGDKHLNVPHNKDDNKHIVLHINKGKQYRLHVKDTHGIESILLRYESCLSR